MNKVTSSKSYPVFILIILSLIWGSSFILIKRGLDTFSPLQVGTIRVGFAFILLLPFALKHVKSIFRNRWKKFVLFGLTANLIPAILFAAAETGLSSSLTGILNSLTPISTLIIGAVIFGTSINSKQSSGLAIGFVGSFMLSLVGADGELGSFNFYALFVIAATICYGFAGNMVKSYFSDINSITITALAFFSVGPAALIYLLFSDFTTTLSTVDGAWISLLYLFLLAALGTAFALVLFNKLIQTTTAVFASTVTYLIPVTAVAWGILDGEDLFPLHFAGMGLIIFGVYLTNKFK